MKKCCILVLVLSLLVIFGAAASADGLNLVPQVGHTIDMQQQDEPLLPQQNQNPHASLSKTVPEQPKLITPPAIVPEVPKIVPEAMEADLSDYATPLSAGNSGLVVDVVSDTLAPQFGDFITLRAFVVNPAMIPIAYRWQIDRGWGFEDILLETASEFRFYYTPELVGCAFRVAVDLAT